MKIIDIELKNREKIKEKENIPAILYGKGIDKSYPCMVNRKEFIHLVKSNSRNIILNCKLDDGRVFPTLIKDIQKDVISFDPIHIDFFAISLSENIKMSVPIYPIGEAKGVKVGGILEQVTFKIDLKAKPADIPDKLNVDISNLEIGDSIHVGDIGLSEEIELMTPLDTPVFTIVSPKAEEVVPTPTETAIPPEGVTSAQAQGTGSETTS
ncbi:MAG: 50S ribosomal protein L25 [Caldisericia bacterium]|jgi:large subunit ribosomal protein L25|nr:50S ribosomal protein L25 [Caldisericia bacterium]MDD5689487.1 50S ribosomal protein L25 [Caldisericia bacterium]HOJ16028.1 50S ribosomal protein L25 [Caldisericia bacterium]HOW02949.1 50S ribosomal protein L25 [Caldisericia bacterium]HPO29150.1 50S ribosomal protein L25 [Caldisericia bacterium]